MGIGDDGHTASLFPGEVGVDVVDRLVIAVPAAPDRKREARLTVTVPVIEACRAIFMLVVREDKRDALERAWSPMGSTRETPARVMRGVRGSVTWIIDKAASGST
jgi:6-phosphogluconolactonase